MGRPKDNNEIPPLETSKFLGFNRFTRFQKETCKYTTQHILIGFLAGAARLRKFSGGLQSNAQVEQKSTIEHKGKSIIHDTDKTR